MLSLQGTHWKLKLEHKPPSTAKRKTRSLPLTSAAQTLQASPTVISATVEDGERLNRALDLARNEDETGQDTLRYLA